MKKLLLILTLLSIPAVQAQTVSPFYPKVNIAESPSQFKSQFTYFDSNFISNRISELMEFKYMMTAQNYDDSKLLHNGGTLKFSYVDKFSTSGNKKLDFDYKIFSGLDEYIVQSVKITGSPERVIRFYTTYWNTTLEIKEYGKNAIIENNFGQDVINLHLNNGKPYITIKNSTFKTNDEFLAYFQSLKENDAKASL